MASVRVTMQRLEGCGSEAKLSSLLGQRLYALWGANHHRVARPHLKRGEMVVLLARGQGVTGMLAPGFLLPLLWRAGQPDDPRLPQGLIDVAHDVQRHVNPAERWGLALGEGIKADLSGLDFATSWDSAWTTLAASLIVVSQGGQPDGTVFATAAYHKERDEVLAVEGIEAKLEALSRLDGAGDKLCVFVAAANMEGARQVVEQRGWSEQIELRAYPVRSSMDDKKWSMYHALEPHLDRLAVPPDDATRLVDWVNQASLSMTRRESYYMAIVKELADRLRKACEEELGAVSTLMVAAGDRNCNQAALLSLALRPERVLLLCLDSKSRASANQFVDDFSKREGWSKERIMIEMLSSPPSQADVDVLYKKLDQRAVVDVTAGTRPTLWAMMEMSRRAGARTTYIEHKSPGSARYGGERLFVFNEMFYGNHFVEEA